MTSCYKGWIPKNNIYNGKCKDYMIPPCWQGYHTFTKGKGKCAQPKVDKWYVRLCVWVYGPVGAGVRLCVWVYGPVGVGVRLCVCVYGPVGVGVIFCGCVC